MVEVAILIGALMVLTTACVILLGWVRRRWDGNDALVGTPGLEATRQIELLSDQNAGLRGQVGRLEERIAVLERIATDPATRTAHEIEQLRNS